MSIMTTAREKQMLLSQNTFQFQLDSVSCRVERNGIWANSDSAIKYFVGVTGSVS